MFRSDLKTSKSCVRSKYFSLGSRVTVIHDPGAHCGFLACPYRSSTCACRFTLHLPAIFMTRITARPIKGGRTGQYYISPEVEKKEILRRKIPNHAFSCSSRGNCNIENIAEYVLPSSESTTWMEETHKVTNKNFECSATLLTFSGCLCSDIPGSCQKHNDMTLAKIDCRSQLQVSTHGQVGGSSRQQSHEIYGTSVHDLCQQFNNTADPFHLDSDDTVVYYSAFAAEILGDSFSAECLQNMPAPGQGSSSGHREGICPINFEQCVPLPNADVEQYSMARLPVEDNPLNWPAYQNDPQIQEFYYGHDAQDDQYEPHRWQDPAAGTSQWQGIGSDQEQDPAAGTSQPQNPGPGEGQNQGQHQRQNQWQYPGQDQGQDPTFDKPWPFY
ncbi:hypothetical protein BCR37DRAFT_378003 [Protomyces lactucae-debilis]|uniref:Uncharacterized protein n=1 Tax=Protomyces lactucae-debilis TaxID=2754530 RepID=A0A1Y2FNX0_PROLT|nr:uncharacterized protein BCR37DRAFT_378003 [Protomyces lactucae-debilis]ORY85024.1 hypothetical protein BCR37DRAFT_378003 [Protomyces lactucae-debilis]